MTALVGGVLLAAGVALFILEPVFSGRRATLFGGDDDFDEGAARRRVALTALRDLEYDRATGKLDEEDYDALKLELSREALMHLGREEDAGEGPETEALRISRQLEDEIAQIRRAIRRGMQCVSCEHVNGIGARYCGRCGKRLATGAAPAGTSSGGAVS